MPENPTGSVRRSIGRKLAAPAFAAAALVSLQGGPEAFADPAQPVSAGESIARRNCGECHALRAGLASPLPDAPGFADLRRRHDRDAMSRILEERMETVHPRMPALRLDIDEVVEFLRYWDGLQPSAPPVRTPQISDSPSRSPGL